MRKRPIQSVSVSDNVLNIARQISKCLPLVNCLLWLPASIHRLFFLQLVQSAIDTYTMMKKDQRKTHLPFDYSLFWRVKSKSSSRWICLIHQKIETTYCHLLLITIMSISTRKKNQFSAAPFAMLINVDSSHIQMYTLPINNQERSKAFFSLSLFLVDVSS